jgi:WD40 repeat protein
MAGDAVTPERSDETKARVFISYARADLAFADRLAEALKARGFETLIDRSEIYAFEDWWKRIETLVVRADAVVFVLSPDSAASEVCAKEIRFATSLNKRLAPIVARRVDDKVVPEALRRLNFIFFDDAEQFELRLAKLAEALATDIDWVRKHTEFGEAARRWSAAGRPGPRGLLLRSPVLEEAESWIVARPPGAPPPTEETQALVAESRRSATRRRNVLTASLAAGLVIALVLAGLAYWQRGIAVEQRDASLRTQSRFLTDLANQKNRAEDAGTAAMLAIQALPDTAANAIRPYIASAELSLSSAMSALREKLILKGHTRQLYTAEFSPDGLLVVTASEDKTARVWQAATGRELAVLSGHKGSVYSAVFSPDSRRVVTASEDNTVRVWDANSGTQLALLKGHTGAVHGAVFSPDGRLILSGAQDQTARVWDSATGQELKVLRPVAFDRSYGYVERARFSADGRRIVTISRDSMARVWDVSSGETLCALYTRYLVSAAPSPDGRSVVITSMESMDNITSGYSAKVWDCGNRAVVATLKGHSKDVSSAVFSPDGELILTASPDGTARVWNATGGALLATLTHGQPLASADFSPDGRRILTLAWNGTVKVWDVQSKQELAVLGGHAANVGSAAFDTDGRHVVTASKDGTARIWDAEAGEGPILLAGHASDIVDLAFSSDGSRIMTASSDATARMWDTRSGKQLVVLGGHSGGVRGAIFSPDDQRVLTASDDGTARLWDGTSGGLIAVLAGGQSAIEGAAFSPDGKRIVTASADRTARLWDGRIGTLVGVLATPARSQPIQDLHGQYASPFSPDSREVVTVSGNARVQLWDAGTGNPLDVIAVHSTIVAAAAFIAGRLQIVSVVKDPARNVWVSGTTRELAVPFVCIVPGRDVEPSEEPGGPTSVPASGGVTPPEAAAIETPGLYCNRVSFSPDGRRIVTQRVLWDSETGRRLASLGGGARFDAPRFTADGRRFVTAAPGNDGVLQIRLSETGDLIAAFKLAAPNQTPFKLAATELTTFTISRDGTLIAAAFRDGAARIQRVFPTTQDLVNHAKAVVARCLTQAQRESTFLDPEPPAWCIEMGKWPYQTDDWKAWLKAKRENLSPPLPDTPEWPVWIASHK